MKTEIISDFVFGQTAVRYQADPASGRVELLLYPAEKSGRLCERREHLTGPEVAFCSNPVRAYRLDSLVQVSLAECDRTSAYAQGRTMREGPTVDGLRFEEQFVGSTAAGTRVRTTLGHAMGWRCHHDLFWPKKACHLEMRSEIENCSERPITVELLSSFSLGGITPFDASDACGRLKLHRFRSVWSMEGRLETRAFEDLQLENSWISHGVRCERFGVVGSLPVNGFFPFVAVEDTKAHVLWGAQLAHPGSWQMEVYRKGDTVSVSGGLADREFGQWWKVIEPGESFLSPRAAVACVSGDLDDLCDVLVKAQERVARPVAPSERTLPVVFNEWATTWGRPSHEQVAALVPRAKQLGARYFVIDTGWYAPADGDWTTSHGDWEANAEQFPSGLKATADLIRRAGLVPGIWFEMETCGPASETFRTRTDLLLHRDGAPLTATRRFLDFRKARTLAFLEQKVIRTLRECGFGYLKVDYNETIGFGVDGCESPGEGLRQHLEGVQSFFEAIHREIPGILIENCASGGHRTEPSMVGLTAMSSFSDAHECPEIPVIASNLQRLIPPRQSQIWAVLRAGDDPHRIVYSLAAAFLGRLCISGDIQALSPEQIALVKRAVAFYRRQAPVIREGKSQRFGPEVRCYRHPEGWQAVLRISRTGDRAMLVAHTFGGRILDVMKIPLPEGRWGVNAELRSDLRAAKIVGGALVIPAGEQFRGRVIDLRKAL